MSRKQQAASASKKRKAAETDDGPADKVVSITALAKTKKKPSAKQRSKKPKDEVTDIVNALLGEKDKEDRNKKQKRPASKKKKIRTDKSAPSDDKKKKIEKDNGEEEPTEFNDDDVADLYAWSSSDDEDLQAHNVKQGNAAEDPAADKDTNDAVLKAERQRALQLAVSVAEDTSKHKSDLPKDENEWFDRMDEEQRRDRKSSNTKPNAQGYQSDDDLPANLVRASQSASDKRPSGLTVKVPKEKREAVGKFLAIDCEMVGAGFKGSISMLARVSIVNYYGHVILDTYVQPTEKVTDYRTWVSGIRKEDLESGRPFKEVQKLVSDLTKDRILIGHAIKNDLNALLLSHPPSLIRDTALYPEFRQLNKGAPASLRMLAATVLNLNIQEGEHSSVVDAKTTMLLYRKAKDRWEKELAPRRYRAQMLREKSKARFEQLRKEIQEERTQLKIQHEQQLKGIYKQ